MWASIENIAVPASLQEAYALIVPDRKVLFSGGSYLVAEKASLVDTLIDIRHLLDSGVSEADSILHIGAAATLQEIVGAVQSGKAKELARCARWSCPSKNIRNQRTIGGEIGRRRVDSELAACLYALNATLHIVTHSSGRVAIRDWDGDGIVTGIDIPMADIGAIAVQRFALLPSAPAFAIVIGVQRAQGLDIAIGGRARRLSTWTIPSAEYSDERITEIASMAAKQFESDQYGSLAYKEAVIRAGLRRVMEGP